MELELLKEKNGVGFAGISIFWFICLLLGFTNGKVVLVGRNVSESFPDIEANFASAISDSGEVGILFLAEPFDACAPLTNEVFNGSRSSFVLIIRGGCAFDDKIRHAQIAGFAAAVVFNNEDSGLLIAMAGNPEGISIPAVFVSGFSGEVLKEHAGRTDTELWIIPTFEDSAWPIMTLSVISLLVVTAVLGSCFFLRRRFVRRARPRANQFHGTSSHIVKAMPSLRFSSKLEGCCTSRTCAICLEDYKEGEILRVLPCHHNFHASCVDTWLMMWRSFCPLCKQDVRINMGNRPASESTPLLSPAHSSPSSTIDVTSRHSQMNSLLPQPTPSSLAHLLSGTAHTNPPVSSNASRVNCGSVNFVNSASERLFVSPHSNGFPLSFPLGSRYHSQSIPTSDSASTSRQLTSSLP